jgi:hypothetical protein
MRLKVHSEKNDSLEAVINYVQQKLAEHTERDSNKALELALAGEKREFPVISIGHLGDPADTFIPQGELKIPEAAISNPQENALAKELLGKLEPLKMLNPISLDFSLGKGPGTLVACFGIPLNPDTMNCPAHTKSIGEVLSQPMPDPKKSGLMQEMLKKISIIKELTPDTLKIALPDTQGPFNIAHSLVGEEALVEAYLDPKRFHQLIDKVTDFWIKTVMALKDAIGEERKTVSDRMVNIAECSVNLISPEMYKEFILPYDLKIAEVFGAPGIHTCSGSHVFYATLENIPGMVYTEAGYIACAVAGHTKVDEAMAALRDKPVLLRIGQELPEGKELDTVLTDLLRYSETKRLLFSYTGMHWRKKDRPLIRDIHNTADEFWKESVRQT